MGMFLEPIPQPALAFAKRGRNFLQDVEARDGGSIYFIVVCRGGRPDSNRQLDPADSLAKGHRRRRSGLVIVGRLAGFVIGGHNHTWSARDVVKTVGCCGEPLKKKKSTTELRDTKLTPIAIIIVHSRTGHILPPSSLHIVERFLIA